MSDATTRILRVLVVILAAVMAFTTFYHLFFQSYETENAVYYEVSDVTAFQGVYVREERPLRYSGQGAVRYLVEDGAKLGVGSAIAEIYADEEQIDLRRSIAEKEAEIEMLNRLQNPGSTRNVQPESLSAQITQEFKDMVRLRELGSFSEMTARKSDLALLMNTYDKTTNAAIDYSARKTALETETAQLRTRLQEPEQVIRADSSAYFVSYVDGYEEKLNMENAAGLTPQELRDVSDSGGARNLDENAVGKLVDSYEWYITGIFDNNKLRLTEGDTASVRLASFPKPLQVTVESLMSGGDITQTQAVFRCEQMTSEVVQHRTERVEIVRNTVTGVRVPRSAIRFKDVEVEVEDEDGTHTETQNCMGVYVLIGETAEFRRVDVVYEDETFYLSSLDAPEGFVALYDDIITKGVMADGD